MLNYFEILNVSENAEYEVIKASYRTLAKKYHPDHSVYSKQEAEKKMQLLNEAYQVLSNEQKRQEHLIKLHKADTHYYKEDNADRENGTTEDYTEYTAHEEPVASNINDNTSYGEGLFYKFITYMVNAIILAVIIGILVHFVPDMISEYISMFSNGLEKLLNNY